MRENESEIDALIVALFSEIFASEQLIKQHLSRALPRGMELSHFMTLNYLETQARELSPAHLARVFNLTRGAMTNTIGKLELRGYVHSRPDWDDARRKWISISDAGKEALRDAQRAVNPIFSSVIKRMGTDHTKAGLPFLRELRISLEKQ